MPNTGQMPWSFGRACSAMLRGAGLLVFLLSAAVGFEFPAEAQIVLEPAGSAAEQHHARALELAAAGDDAGAGASFLKAWEEDRGEGRYVHDLTVYYIHHRRYS